MLKNNWSIPLKGKQQIKWEWERKFSGMLIADLNVGFHTSSKAQERFTFDTLSYKL
jgi:hypothetical protein